MGNPRDVNIKIDADDRTGPGTRAAARNIDRLERKLGNTASVAKRVTGAITSTLGTVAATAGKAAGPIGVAVAAAVGVTLGPQLVTLIGGAIQAGGVLGVIGLAAYLQKDNPALKKAVTGLKSTVKKGLENASKPLADDFVRAVNRIDKAANRAMPLVGRAFKAVEPFIVPVTDGFLAFVNEAAPGFVRMLEKSAPVMDALTDSLPLIGKGLGMVFDAIGNSAPESAQAIRDLGLVLTVFLGVLANSIRMSSRYYAVSRSNFLGILSVVTTAMIGGTRAVSAFVAGTLRGLASLAAATGQERLAAKLRGMADSVDNTARQVVADLRGIQAAINGLRGKDVWVNVKVGGLGGLNKAKQIAQQLPAGGGFSTSASFATSDRGAGMARTGGPAPIVNASTTVLLDGDVIRTEARTVITHENARQAWRARTGRR